MYRHQREPRGVVVTRSAGKSYPQAPPSAYKPHPLPTYLLPFTCTATPYTIPTPHLCGTWHLRPTAETHRGKYIYMYIFTSMTNQTKKDHCTIKAFHTLPTISLIHVAHRTKGLFRQTNQKLSLSRNRHFIRYQQLYSFR